MKLRTIGVMAAAAAILVMSLPGSFATPPKQNPGTNFVAETIAMLTGEGMSAGAATNLAKAINASGGTAALAIYSSHRDYVLNAQNLSSVTGIPFTVTGIVYPSGSASAQVTGITNSLGGWSVIGYAGGGLWQMQPSGGTYILTGRVDNIQGLLP
jgi:hypothetical protein